MTGDMTKILKSCFFKKQFFTFNFSKKCKNWHFLKKQFFSFLIISPVIFDLQKRTIPQIKALNILFWPYFIHFIARMDIWWAMKPRMCPGFFSSDFTSPTRTSTFNTTGESFQMRYCMTFHLKEHQNCHNLEIYALKI